MSRHNSSSLEVYAGRRREPPLGRTLEGLSDMSKESIVDLPRFDLAKNAAIYIASNAVEADECVEFLRNSMSPVSRDQSGNLIYVLGFDTESKPNFHKGQPQNPVAMVQLATPQVVVLFRVFMFESQSLWELIEQEHIIKVGVGVFQDTKALGVRNNRGFYDVERALRTRFPSLRRCGLRGAIASCTGMSLPKAQSTANWERRVFSKAMIYYAANDALAGLYLFSVVTDSNLFGEIGQVERFAQTTTEQEMIDSAWNRDMFHLATTAY